MSKTFPILIFEKTTVTFNKIKMKRCTQLRQLKFGLTMAFLFAFMAVPSEGNTQTVDCKEVFISEYVDGAGKNKVLELFNPTDDSIDLLGYSILVYYDGASEPLGIHLTGTIPAKGVYLLAFDESDASILSIADQVSADFHPNGNDAIEFLKQGGTVLDVIGEPGIDPGPAGWTVGNGSTNDHTLVRLIQCKRGEPNWGLCQNQWNAFANQQTSGLGDHLGICRNASDYVVEVTVGLDPSYPEAVCGGPNPCIPITIVVTPIVTGIDVVYVEIDKNPTCPQPLSIANDDEKFPNGSVLVFVPGGPNPQNFELLIIDDAVNEQDENLCLEVSYPGNICINCLQNTVIIDDDMVGIEELMAQTSLKISPNPASETLYLRNLPGIKNIEIRTILGQQILPNSSVAGGDIEISVSNLVPGLYFLSFEYKGQAYFYKFLKQ
jgi:hypothetical protein